MYRQRVLETRLQALCDSGELAADLHFGTGQEAVAAGVCAALRPQDMVLCHHRMIGQSFGRALIIAKIALLQDVRQVAAGIAPSSSAVT